MRQNVLPFYAIVELTEGRGPPVPCIRQSEGEIFPRICPKYTQTGNCGNGGIPRFVYKTAERNWDFCNL